MRTIIAQLVNSQADQIIVLDDRPPVHTRLEKDIQTVSQCQHRIEQQDLVLVGRSNNEQHRVALGLVDHHSVVIENDVAAVPKSACQPTSARDHIALLCLHSLLQQALLECLLLLQRRVRALVCLAGCDMWR